MEWFGWVLMREAQAGGLGALSLYIAGLLVAVGGGAGGCALVSLLVEAIHKADMTEDQACREMEIDPAQWSRQKSGESRNHASLQRAGMLPSSVLAWWAVLILVKYGIPREIRRGAYFYFGLLGHRRLSRPVVAEERAVS